MPKFLTIGYGDRAGYERSNVAAQDAAHVHDDQLRAQGVEMGLRADPCRSETRMRLGRQHSTARSCLPTCQSQDSR